MGEKFTTEVDGVAITLPSLNQLPMKAARLTRKLDDGADKMFTILEMMLQKDQPAALDALDELTTDEFTVFIESWQEFSGIDVGESTAS